MIFEYQGTTYKLSFWYNTITNGHSSLKSTHCVLEKKEGSFFAYREAYASCHPKDQFCKEIGRKLALTKTIQEFSRDFRTKVWDAYFKRKTCI